MIVVSDTSPILYLFLIDLLDLLPQLYGQIIIPDMVRNEMGAVGAPDDLRKWVANPPEWLTIQSVMVEPDETLKRLNLGEQAAISLAESLPADLLLIDEKAGRQMAMARGLNVIGVLGVLDDAASQG
jgi:predicted nucleic acid-binding protein